MNMVLRPQLPIRPWSHPTLLVRSAAGVIASGSLLQPFLSNSRHSRSRIILCTEEKSDFPNMKLRRATSPKIKVTAFRGYAPRLTVESSTKKREHHDNEEEAINTCNRILSIDAPEWIDNRKAEYTEVDLLHNASCSLVLEEVHATEEVGLDINEDDLPGDALDNKSIEKLDKVVAEEEKLEVDLSIISLELDAINEAKAKMDAFEVGLSGHKSSNEIMEEANAMHKTKAYDDNFEVDLSGIALNSARVGEVDAMDEAKSNEDTIAVDLPGNSSSNAIVGEVVVKDDAKSKEDIFLVDLPINRLSNIAMGEVDAVGEAKAKEDIIEFALSRIAFSSPPLMEVISIDESKAKKDISTVNLVGTARNIDAVGLVKAIDEAGTEHDIAQVDFSGISLSNVTIVEVEFMDESRLWEVSGVDLSSSATTSGICKDVVVTDETENKEVRLEMYLLGIPLSNARKERMQVVDEGSAEKDTLEMVGDPDTAKYMAVDFVDETIVEEVNYQYHYTSLFETFMHVDDIDETQKTIKPVPMLVVWDQGPKEVNFIEEGSILKFHQPVNDFHNQEHKPTTYDEQSLSTMEFPEQDLSIALLPEKDHYVIGSPKLSQSIIGFHKQDQSIVEHYRQDTSIVGVPKQTQSIIEFSKPNHSIVSSGKQQRAIVRFPEQKGSIVSFHKKDLSIVSTSREVQTKQVSIVVMNEACHLKVVDANKSKKIFGDTLNVKVVTDNLLQKDIIEQAGDMTSSKKFDEEHLLIIEKQKGVSLGQEQHRVIEEGILVAELQMKMADDELLHFLSGEEISQAGDEMGIIEDKEQHEVVETSILVELGIHESNANVDPQVHQRMLQELVKKHCSLGSILFFYPVVLKANSTIDLLFNRDLSALASEPDVLIKGAFNGWRWRPFTERLHKSELGNDWWCCKLYIPKQAYRLDFVFFNGRTVYENNGNNDFVMQIESDMDERLFEDFLVEEKKKELGRLATEEAERRRQDDDQRQREEERAAYEAIRAQAKAKVGMKKNKVHNVLDLAKTFVDNLWYIEPITSRQGPTVRLYYNRSLRSLAHSTEIWIHGGYNNWIDGLSFAERLVQQEDKDSDWWFVDVVLPERGYVLDWVFADGSPRNARSFDNNDRQDFHAVLPNNKAEVEYWMEEEERIYTRLLQERREKEEAVKRKAKLSAKMKAEMKEKTMRMFLVSQKHIVYTEPLEIHAGTTVNVLYNPSNTVLNGKPEAWFRCSFNRWMHPGGVLPPQKMVKVENGSHVIATVNVPTYAYMMDFVFSESREGGIYDNRNGLDYHIPVFGSTEKEPSMHIVHIAVEMAPIAKIGGLGDVVTSLSRAVQDLGHNVEVILPKHDCLNLSCARNLHVHERFSWGGTEITVWYGLVEDVSVYFLEPQNGVFGVGYVYGRNDDRRFGFFCHSALEFLHQSGSSPHIIHCHDWSSAPVAWLCKEHYAQSCLADARVVFTIHNLEFGAHYVGKAMKYCDKATTVSNTYSREVSGHGAIAPHLGKFFGILNGIDPDIWDPYNDNFIPVHYTSENVVDGKSAAKKALQQKLGLQQNDVPIVGIITRLTAQKGIHLIKHAIHHILERNGQVVLLGSAPDHRIQNDFVNMANTLHGVNYGRVRMCLTYDEPLSHLIYAGSDFILVPSIFEPCGLTQLIAMRYGSVPIVRKTGGLYDTVFDVEHDKDRAQAQGLESNGFSFDGADTNGVDYVLNRAITAWFDARKWFQSLCKRVMEQDWSWNRPALDYIELYRSACKF